MLTHFWVLANKNTSYLQHYIIPRPISETFIPVYWCSCLERLH